ncbi:zinc-binding dehydrogenase [Roseisalinus antarcticus]|uniref:Crotonyl-CoA reductase n=1 Tax=Roseisalinus antarcticus TaxID=254357 RepID=A0A1Y5S378_9RHOB|nr:zinc-binding dehydrogenase [Roseisalinus antarcticus]SLN28696.1 Crotonyl-CoA reductase [Roseisalinus antarcticus]
MIAVVTTGTGGYDRLELRKVPVPVPGPGEALLQVLAAGINNTEINTRLGWYSASVTAATAAADGDGTADRPDGGWNAATPFPFIQGTDCCGRVVAVGPGGDAGGIGARVLVRACMRPHGFGSAETVWMGSDFDGAFAQFVKVPAAEVFAVTCDWSDAELATLPCAYGTAENMLHRAGVAAGDRVLVAGASGGVGLAAVQLARRRGAEVIAIAGKAKAAESVDVVVDNVGGAGFGAMLEVLRRRGSFVTSGAIAGPIVDLDLRTLYLKDLALLGCTGWDAPVFPDLIAHVERGDIRPALAGTFPLDRIAEAQRLFLEKRHVGKLVLIPPPPG